MLQNLTARLTADGARAGLVSGRLEDRVRVQVRARARSDARPGRHGQVVDGGRRPSRPGRPDGTGSPSRQRRSAGRSQSRADRPAVPGSVHDPDWQVRPPDPTAPAERARVPAPEGRDAVVRTRWCRISTDVASSQRATPARTAARVSRPASRARRSLRYVSARRTANGCRPRAAGSSRFHVVARRPGDSGGRGRRGHPGHPDRSSGYSGARFGTPIPGNAPARTRTPHVTDMWNGGGDATARRRWSTSRCGSRCPAPRRRARKAHCSLDTTADALTPGLVREGKRTVWELGQVVLRPRDSTGPTRVADNRPFSCGRVRPLM